jgi:Uma2 family endonuclease
VSYDAYVAFCDTAELKHEFWNGELFAMAGGSEAHALLSANLIRIFGGQLRGTPCRVYSSDLRVRAEGTKNAAYPDLSIVCGPSENPPDDKHAVQNPKLILEVLSDATEAFDRGQKFAYYRRISSLQSYVLVSQSTRCIEVYERDADRGTWELRVLDEARTRYALPSVSAHLELDEVYENVLLGGIVRL